MPASWPVLPAGIGQLGEGLVAQAGPVPVGFVAFDRAGSIPLILVEPGYQRRGIGTGLLEAAMQQLRAGTAASVTAGSGGAGYIWPGVPRDLPAAVAFFASRGWRHSHDTLDLVTDLAGYRAPPGAAGRAVRTGVTITLAAVGDLAAVRAFEAAEFPSWARWFAAARPEQVLLARASSGQSPEPCCWRSRRGHRARAGARPGRGDHRLRRCRCAAARAGNRDGPGDARLRAPQPGRCPHLPHRLDYPRVVLPPRRIPALAALCHVLQPGLTLPLADMARHDLPSPSPDVNGRLWSISCMARRNRRIARRRMGDWSCAAGAYLDLRGSVMDRGSAAASTSV